MRDIISLLLKPLKTTKEPGTKILFLTAYVSKAAVFPACQVLFSLSQKNLVNAFEYGNHELLNTVYLFAALIIGLLLTVHPLSAFYSERSINGIMRELKTYAAARLLSFPMSFFDKRHTGDILMRISSDLETVRRFYSRPFEIFFVAILYGLGSATLMLFLSWPLAIAMIILAACETYAMAKISVKIRENSEIIQQRLGKVNELFLDIVKNLRFIRMASIANILNRKYHSTNDEIVDVNVKRNKTILRMNAVSDLLDAFNLMSILSIGIVLYFYNYIDLGSVVAFLILQDGVTYMSGNLRDVFQQAQQTAVSLRRVFEMLEQDIEEDCPSANREITKIPGAGITVNDICFRYNEQQSSVLNAVSCTFPPGKITVLSGISGKGKSTLVKLLMGLYQPSRGEIHVGDRVYSELSLKTIRDHFAYVPQSAHLFCDTIENNIRAGDEEASMEDVIAAAKRAGAHDFITGKPDGYQTVVQESGTNFSGGEKQRIAIARAVLKDAPVIILDEATSAIDSKMEARIIEYLKEQAEKGRTVLVITHRESLSNIADHSVVVS
ncbi:MAG: ABC transporter ATP-binding protein [Dehalococcoidales bacterium]|nr:ABC transporter ATP-binding protein [Dehalococcoidales bacterium]